MQNNRNTYSQSYTHLLRRSELASSRLLQLGLISKPIIGRYCTYQKMINELDDAWINNKMDAFYNKRENNKFGFALKELREMTEIFDQIIYIHGELSAECKESLRERIDFILSGPDFTVNEDTTNNSARNYQFELRLAARIIQSGYRDITFDVNPDFLVTVDKRAYGFECKRLLGVSNNTIFKNALKAIKQLETHQNRYFGGIVAIDVSAQYEQGEKWLVSTSREDADKQVLDSMQNYTEHLYSRMNNLRDAADKGFVLAIWMNLSTVYYIPDTHELGWIQENAILCLDKENNNAKIFYEDFRKMKS